MAASRQGAAARAEVAPYYERGGATLFCASWQDVLPVECDLVVTDPPYGTGGWRRLQAGQGGNPSGSLVAEDWDDGAVDWLAAVKCDAVLTFWPAARTSALLNAARDCGLTKHRCLYWRKPDPKPLPGGRTRWSVEPIWVLSRDGFLLKGGDDMFERSALRAGQPDATGHPYQKPLDVMLWLIAKTEARRILDPFMGSGSTIVAARTLGRQAVGIEQDRQWCDTAVQRLQQDVLPLDLPA